MYLKLILIHFLLNDRLINTEMPAGMVMVDFIRYHQHLTGTKIGCREGDCGACTILTGTLTDGGIVYSSVTSCLMPLANAHGKHIVTIEGINIKDLNAVQQAMCDEGATQCGFCTPGIVMSLAGFCLQSLKADQHKEACSLQNAVAAVDGNICRCTGYKSIERAAQHVATLVQQNLDKDPDEDPLDVLIARSFVPPYFAEVINHLLLINNTSIPQDKEAVTNLPAIPMNAPVYLSGGTDLYVQQPEVLVHKNGHFIFNLDELKGISRQDNRCLIGAAATVTDILQSPVMLDHFPGIARFIKLVSSTPIRNMATIAGNFVNASPIGDMSIFFLALDAQLILSDDFVTRQLPLRDLYQGYKTLAKEPSEYIKQIWFRLPDKNTLLNFEKVSKRTHLDIASVNTALSIAVEDNIITEAALSAGGVGPIPLFLSGASSFLKGRELSVATIEQSIQQALTEISPISDIRGTATYKRLLLKQLIKAHFIALFPHLKKEDMIYL